MPQGSGTPKNPLGPRSSITLNAPTLKSDDERTDTGIVLPEKEQSSSLSVGEITQNSSRSPLEVEVPQAAPKPKPPTAATPPARPRVGKMPELGPLDGLMADPTITEVMVN